VFGNLSIGRKVGIVVLLSSTLALGLATAGLATYEIATFKARARANLAAIRDVLAVTLSVPEDWLDSRTVAETLNSLKSSTDIVAAAYFRLDGTMFGHYSRDAKLASPPKKAPADGSFFQDGQLRMVETFKCQGQPVGTLDFSSDLGTLKQNLKHSLLILVSVMVVLMGFGVVGTISLQRSIARPLRELAQTAVAVGEKRDYSLRAPVRSQDETGQVAMSFNSMLAGIQTREAALAQSEARFRSVWEYSADGMRLTDRHGTILAVNPAYCTLVGLPSEKLVGQPITAALAPGADSELLMREYRSQFETCTFSTRRELTLTFGSGHTTTVEISTSVIDLGSDKALLTLFRDITQRRQAEMRVRLLHQPIEQSASIIIITDAEGQIEYVNRRFLELTGYTMDEVIGKTPRILKSGHTPLLDYEALWVAIKGGHQWTGEFFNRKKDGTFFWGNTVISPIKDADGKITHFLATEEDITRRKETEEMESRMAAKLRESQRMESLGTLAGGIAHDFNNILSAIIGFSSLAQADAAGNPELSSNLSEVLKASNRAKDLVRRILTFSRQSPQQERRPIHIQPVTLEVTKLLKSTLPATIEMETRLEAENAMIVGDATQMHQVIMNLATNAAFAMRDKPGRLTISLEIVCLDPISAQIHPDLHAGTYIRLIVSDTGCGMSAATLKRMYEPFFTTKAPGEGTGLGLSVVHGIVKDHNGVIIVESIPGTGTTFQLFFPLHQSAELPPESPLNSLPHGNGEHILVVDDEPALARMTQLCLERLGYQVSIQTSPTEALALFTENPNSFHAIITDFSMPRLTGLDLATQVRKIRTDIPIVLTSGFIGKQTHELATSLGIAEIALKPVSPEILAGLVHRLFEKTTNEPRPDPRQTPVSVTDLETDHLPKK
jgi:PAS domain S-box-containing protein